eukprot:scaffold3227_cov214-Amphora_coffeaeformis.AAC.3
MEVRSVRKSSSYGVWYKLVVLFFVIEFRQLERDMGQKATAKKTTLDHLPFTPGQEIQHSILI